MEETRDDQDAWSINAATVFSFAFLAFNLIFLAANMYLAGEIRETLTEQKAMWSKLRQFCSPTHPTEGGSG